MSRRSRDNIYLTVVLVGAAWIVIHFGNTFFLKFEDDLPSVSGGTADNGYIEHAKRMPTDGPNFKAYSRLGALVGRTHLHHQARAAIVQTYAELREQDPSLRFVYGESGWWDGGEFYPHRTHQNGLVVDFMVPVRESGKPVYLPTGPLDGFGYKLEFNEAGIYDGYTVDFDAIALHLLTLRKTARTHGLRIKRVILAPEFQKKLFAAKKGRSVKRRFKFNKKGVWVRHDDHYHVEFEVVSEKPYEKLPREQEAEADKGEKQEPKPSARSRKSKKTRPADPPESPEIEDELEVWPEIESDE